MIKILVRERKSTAVIGIGTILFSLLLGVTLWYFRKADSGLQQMVPACLAVSGILLSGVCFCMVYKNRRLQIEDRELQYSNWLGKKKQFSLDDIGYCRQRESLILYDLEGIKLCKLEFGMTQIVDLQLYLSDNGVKIESSKADKKMLDAITDMQTIENSEIAKELYRVREEVRKHRQEWKAQADKLGASFQIGFACYLESELREDRQLWEQTSRMDDWLSSWDEMSAVLSDGAADRLPEGFLIALEGYLRKDGDYVLNRKEQAVCLVVPVIHVIKSYKIGQETKTILYGDSLAEWRNLMEDLLERLPKRRYHIGELTLRHKLKEL